MRPLTDMAKKKRSWRNIRITRKGDAILAAIDRGTYKFADMKNRERTKDGRFR